MNFKKPKDQIVLDARLAAEYMIRQRLQQGMPYGTSFDQNGVVNLLTFAISEGIGEAMRSIVNNVYTDTEFEEDLTLRNKS